MKDILPKKVRWESIKFEPNYSKKIFNDVTVASSLWKDRIAEKSQIEDSYYIDINKLLWMIECGETKSCYKQNKHYLKGNTKFTDIIQRNIII